MSKSQLRLINKFFCKSRWKHKHFLRARYQHRGVFGDLSIALLNFFTFLIV
jgi:hypothetical protein